MNQVINGKCEEVLKTFPDNYFDSCVTDPPYGISFMNKHWDYQVPSIDTWSEILRVLKPGAHILVACGTRTQHRMVVNIEDAGFEIRDVITWHYGSGFPKSLDISKAIDKQAGAEREVTGYQKATGNARGKGAAGHYANGLTGVNGYEPIKEGWNTTSASTGAAKEWEGWGTALKPATEFWTLARKPISENTIAENVLKHGTGGINIDGSRIETEGTDYGRSAANSKGNVNKGEFFSGLKSGEQLNDYANSQGRFPANVIFDEFTGKILDEQTGILTSGYMSAGTIAKGDRTVYGSNPPYEIQTDTYGDTGGASRFFYCPKADNYERNKGLNGFDGRYMDEGREIGSAGGTNPRNRGAEQARKNYHPTVKPIDLMRYLVKLITPKHGISLDPFGGSGTTGIGCKLELINYVLIELNKEYCDIATARIAAWNPPKYIEQTLF